MDHKVLIVIGSLSLIVIISLLLCCKKKSNNVNKEGFINGRPNISTQDNCSKCSTKYTKYAHNKPLNSDGQIMM